MAWIFRPVQPAGRYVMSPGVFDAGTTERLRERINQDGAFRQVSQDMTLNMALETDGAARLVTFRDGTLASTRPFVTVTKPVDRTIRGDTTFWRNLLSRCHPRGFRTCMLVSAPGPVTSAATPNCIGLTSQR
jgi:hypothetical protein